MANHITNKLTIIGDKEQAQEVLEFIQMEEDSDYYEGYSGIGTIDFNKIIPMPDNIYRGDLSSELRKKYPNNWHNWSIENWGNKWNAYDCYIDGNDTLCFKTAWNGVPNLMQKLSNIFPNVTISYRYCDEDDIGSNMGSFKFKNGEIIDSFIPKDNSKEAYELAFDILDIEPLENTYKYCDGIFTYDEKEGTYIYEDAPLYYDTY